MNENNISIQVNEPMIESRTLRYVASSINSLNELKEIFAAGETISTETVQKTLKSNYIDYTFFIELINVDGLYNVWCISLLEEKNIIYFLCVGFCG